MNILYIFYIKLFHNLPLYKGYLSIKVRKIHPSYAFSIVFEPLYNNPTHKRYKIINTLSYMQVLLLWSAIVFSIGKMSAE